MKQADFKLVIYASGQTWVKTLAGDQLKDFFSNHPEVLKQIEDKRIISVVIEVYPIGKYAQYQPFDYIPDGYSLIGLVSPTECPYDSVIKWAEKNQKKK